MDDNTIMGRHVADRSQSATKLSVTKQANINATITTSVVLIRVFLT